MEKTLAQLAQDALAVAIPQQQARVFGIQAAMSFSKYNGPELRELYERETRLLNTMQDAHNALSARLTGGTIPAMNVGGKKPSVSAGPLFAAPVAQFPTRRVG